MPQQPYLLADGLTCELPPDRTLFRNVQASVFPGDRIALVGANGVGKSTLLQILAGQSKPTAGHVHQNGSVDYLPQISTLQQVQHQTVLDILAATSEEWWNITSLLETQFHTVLDLAQSIAQLSGGELTKLLLSIALSQNPNVLLLDEPTNHLDYQGLEELRRSLQTFSGAFVIVSHKPQFLDQVVDTIWELTPDGLSVYGGNFSAYREQKQTEQEARERSHEVARKQLRHAQRSAMQEQLRIAQSRKQGRQKFLSGSMDRVAAGSLKRKAEATAGKQKLKHEKTVATATQKVAETKIRTTKATVIQLEEKSHKHRNLLEIQGASLWIEDRLLVDQIHFQLRYGDRVAIAGTNGSGKSSLIRAILGDSTEAVLKSGEVLLALNLSAVYLDQSYELVDRQRTVLENMQSANPSLEYQLVRQQLGHFLFGDRAINKPAAALSGGELARLSLAMISVSAIDLLVLDEPSNNLDIATVNQMVNAVNDYEGALVVISHDIDFLRRIDINRAFKIHEQWLQRTMYLPAEVDQYYRELLDA